MNIYGNREGGGKIPPDWMTEITELDVLMQEVVCWIRSHQTEYEESTLPESVEQSGLGQAHSLHLLV